MRPNRLVRAPLGVRPVAVLGLSLAIGLAFSARADLTPWDQQKVTALADQLVSATNALYNTFYKQPVPTLGSAQSRGYQRLKQDVKRIKSEARQLAGDLRKGKGREATTRGFQDLMVSVRDAREEARSVFTGADVAEKAAAARAVLEQLGPYYDPNFELPQPPPR
jgi:hypothetical protein